MIMSDGRRVKAEICFRASAATNNDIFNETINELSRRSETSTVHVDIDRIFLYRRYT